MAVKMNRTGSVKAAPGLSGTGAKYSRDDLVDALMEYREKKQEEEAREAAVREEVSAPEVTMADAMRNREMRTSADLFRGTGDNGLSRTGSTEERFAEVMAQRQKERGEELRRGIGIGDISALTDPAKALEAERRAQEQKTLADINESIARSHELFGAKVTGTNVAMHGLKDQTAATKALNTLTSKVGAAYVGGVLEGAAQFADAVKANAAGVKAAAKNALHLNEEDKPDKNGMISLAPRKPRKTNAQAFTDAKIDEILFGRSYSEEIAKQYADTTEAMIRERYGESGQAMQYIENAARSKGNMLLADVVTMALGGAPAMFMGMSGKMTSGDLAGMIMMAPSAGYSYMKEAAASMLSENAALAEQGKPPKYTKEEIRRKATAAEVNGILIEAVGEYALGKAESFVGDMIGKSGVGKAAAEMLSKSKFGKFILNAVTNPVGSAIVKYGADSGVEGLEEVVQGIAGNASKKLYDDSATVFSGEDWKEYLDSGIVGTIMGAAGGALGAVQQTVSGVQTMEYVRELTKAANAVRNEGEAADVSAIIASEIGTLDDIIAKAREQKSGETEQAGTARETEKTGKTTEEKTPEGKTKEGKTSEGKTKEGKTSEGKTSEGKTERVRMTEEEAREYAAEFYAAEENGGKKKSGDGERAEQEKRGDASDEEIPEEVKDLAWARDRLSTVLEILADKNTREDIEANNIAKGQADNGIMTGYELFYEGNADRVLDDIRNAQKKTAGAEQAQGERQTGAEAAQEAITERANENQGNGGITLVGDSDAEFDVTAELESSGVRRDLAEYGIDVTVVRGGDSMMDPDTGKIQISSTTPTREVLNIVTGHEISHAAARGDVNFTKDVLAAFRNAGVNVDGIIRGIQETYVKGYVKRGMSEEAARKKVTWNFAMEEASAELIGRMNQNGDIIGRLAQRNQSVLAKIYDAVMDIIGNITGNDKLKREYRTLAREIRKALKAEGYTISSRAGAAERKNGNDKTDEKQETRTEEKERDREYLDAVNRGDTEKAESLVREAAKEAGYDSPDLYHGTENFGFTVFDPNVSDDGISLFFTDDPEVAKTYSGTGKTRKISERNQGSRAEDMNAEELAEAYEGYLQKDGEGKSVRYVSGEDLEKAREEKENFIRGIRESIDSVRDGYGINYFGKNWEKMEKIRGYLNDIKDAVANGEERRIAGILEKIIEEAGNDKWLFPFENREKVEHAVDAMKTADVYGLDRTDRDENGGFMMVDLGTRTEAVETSIVRNAVSRRETTGNYRVAAKLGKSLVIHANGAGWNEIETEDDGKNRGLSGLHTTREIAAYAKENGYDSVVFEDIEDNGKNAMMELAFGDEDGITETSNVYVVFDGKNVKSLDDITYDDEGRVIPLSERFSERSNDVRYRMTDETDSEGRKISEKQSEYFKDTKIRDEEGNLLVVYHGTDQSFTAFDMEKGRANMDIQGAFFSPWEIDAEGYGEKVTAYYLNIKNPADERTGYRALNRFKGQNEAGKKARMYLEKLGYDGVNNGNEEYIAFYPNQIKRIDNKNPSESEDTRFRMDELDDMDIPLPEFPTNEDRQVRVTEEAGEAPVPGTYAERTAAAISQQEEEEAGRTAARERMKVWADTRAKELAETFGIPEEAPAETAGISAQENPDLEGIDIPSLAPAEKTEDKGKNLRTRAAEMQIVNAMREHEHMKQAYRNRADNEKRKGIRALYEPVYQKVMKAIVKLTPRGTMERGRAVDAADVYETQRRENEIELLGKKLKRIGKELYDADTDSSVLNDWKYASDERRRELEDRYPALREYAEASDRIAELRAKKKTGRFTTEFMEMMYHVNGLLGRTSQTEDVTQEEYDRTMKYMLAFIGDYAQKAEGTKDAGNRYFTAETAEERAEILAEMKNSEDKRVKQLAKMIDAFRVIEENADGLDERAKEIDERWERWYQNTVENSTRMKELRDTYESYQADLDAARLSVGNRDLTPEELETVRANLEKRREDAKKTRDAITDADRVMAREFLDSAEETDAAEKETAEFVRAYMVAQRILDADAAETELAEDERAARRLEDYRARADGRRQAFIDENRAEIERYMAAGETEESAAMLVRRDQRKNEQQKAMRKTVLGRLGYHIAGAVREDYGNAEAIRASEDMIRKTRKAIGAYINKFSVNPHVDAMAQDVAKNKLTILETGLSGVQLENLRGLVPMYRELYDYEENGIKARKRDVLNQQMNELDAAFRAFNPSQMPKSEFWKKVLKWIPISERSKRKIELTATKLTRKLLQNYANPENIMRDMFGDTELAQYLTDNYVTPVIRNSAEARRMTNRQLEKLNSYHLTRDESALVQIVAEYANLAQNSDTGEDARPVLSRENLIAFLRGEITAKELTQKLGAAEIGALVGDQVTDRQAQKMAEDAAQEGEIDTESTDSDFERDLQRQTEEYLARNGVKTGEIEAKTGLELTLERIAAYAKDSGKTAEEIADRTMNAASDMRDMMNDMYEAINEMYVTHGGKELKYRKNYMPHQQPEDVKNALDKVFGMMDLEQVKELPVEIAGRTREFRPFRKWQKFEQQRKGEETVYDAVGNVADYLRAANEGIYHIDDIMKLRTLETYIRNRYAEHREDYRKMILDEMLETEQTLRRNEENRETAEDRKQEEAVMSEFVQYLKLYTDDLAGKQVFRDTEEIIGRDAMNIWGKIVAMSNRALIDFNVGSSLKQLSQMPGVAAIVGRENAKRALEYALKSGNDLNAAYDIENRSTFLAEKLERAEPDYGDKTQAQIALDAVRDGLAQFDRLNSRFAVYAFFLKGQEEGMEADEAMEYADRMARQINASRMRGAAPLMYRSKNIIANILNMYQRETTAQWELYAKVLPREFKRYLEKNGKEATVKLVAKKILEHQIATGLFNTMTAAIGLGTPAMFDIFGTFIRSFFKSMLPDEDELTVWERFREFFNGIGKEAADDLGPLANIYEFVWGDDTGRLPIGQVSLKNLKKTGDAAVQAVKDAWSGDADSETVENLLQGFSAAAVDIMAPFVPGGGQLKKTLHAAADIARGGHFSGAGRSGKLQYTIPWYEVPGALVFGVSSTHEAQEYYRDYRALTEKQTEVWKRLTGSGMDSKRAYDAIRAVSSAGKKADKEAAIDGSRLGGYEKALLWQGMLASDKANEAIRDAAGGMTGAGFTEVVDTVRAVSGLKTTREKIGAILESGLNAEQMMDVYSDMVAEWTKDEDGNPVMMTDYAKIKSFESEGMGIRDYLEARKEYQDINAEDGLSAQKKAASYFEWADDKGYTDRQIDLITDTFRYYNQVGATTDTYRKYKDAGLTQDTTFDVMDAVKGKTRIADKTDAIRGMYLSDNDTMAALSVVLSESTYEKVRAGMDAGMKLEDYVSVLRGDANGNGSLTNEERRAAIDAITGLDSAARSVLWTATGGSAKGNPYAGSGTGKAGKLVSGKGFSGFGGFKGFGGFTGFGGFKGFGSEQKGAEESEYVKAFEALMKK